MTASPHLFKDTLQAGLGLLASKSHCTRKQNKVFCNSELDLNLNLWKTKANTNDFSEKLKINKPQKLKQNFPKQRPKEKYILAVPADVLIG